MEEKKISFECLFVCDYGQSVFMDGTGCGMSVVLNGRLCRLYIVEGL